MRIKLHKTLGVLLVVTVWAVGCIREDVMLPPTLDPLSNSSIASGTLLTLKGNYLGRSAVVFLNDTARSLQGKPTLTEIQFIVPHVNKRTQSVIYVTTEFGSSEPMPITLLPPIPFVKKVIPSRAPAGKTIKIVGSYFEEVTVVQFRSAAQQDWTDVNPTKVGDTLKVIVPNGLDRDAADIRVKSASGESNPPAPFMVLIAPEIESLSTEKAGPGELVTIVGKDFDYVIDVLFGKFSAEILSTTSTTLMVRVPTDAVTDDLVVETEGGSTTYAKKFIIVPKPVVTSFDKRSGNVGTPLTVMGFNLADATEIRFGSTPAEIEDQNEGSLKTKIPSGAQSGKIYITGPGGTGESAEDFIVEGTPYITMFEPSTGAPNTVITITGFNLSTVTNAKINLTDLEIDEASKTDTQVKVKILAGSATGKISVTSPGGKFETTKPFTIIGSPEIKMISPTSGAPGAIVTISGENFPENPTVKFFNGVTASVISSTAKQITCQVPEDATDGVINVHGALSQEFKIIIKPTITKIDPMKGATTREIVITGAHLKDATVKFFNNITATVIARANDKLTVRVPAGAATGKITVTTTGGTATSINDFEVILPPAITSFTPATGVAGTTVTIIGTNLNHNPAVFFYNQIAATISSTSPNQLLVVVPAGASTGKISIRTDASSTPAMSTDNFTVVPKPRITLITPGTGTIHEKVTIEGTSFRDVISVSFDGVTTNTFVVAPTDTRITVRVPKTVNGNANRTINVSVRTPADVSGNYPFQLQGTPTITKISPNNNPLNWAFLIEGTNLESVKKISIGGKIPDIDTDGIDKRTYNYITTKVPKDITPSANHRVYLHYTSEDSAISRPYNVLSVPPPGVFPPPTIILPPPIPSSYVQTDLSDYWIDENFVSTGPDPMLSCYQLRAAFSGQPSGNFCEIGKFYAIDEGNPVWNYTNKYSGWGSWNLGKVVLNFSDGDVLTGQVLDQAASKLILTNKDGRQVILVNDKSGGCMAAFNVVGPCN